MKKLGKGILLSVAVLAVGGLLAGCGSKDEVKPLDEKKVTIGVTSGPHQQIIEEVARQAKKDGIEINVKSFDDYNTPNGYEVVNMTWSDRLMLMPIPQGAMDLNPLLRDDQNPGY